MSLLVESSPVTMGMTPRGSSLRQTTPHSPDNKQQQHQEYLDTGLSPPTSDGFLDVSRSPSSVGETFISAATDGPLSSHAASDSSSDSDSDVELEELEKGAQSPSLNSPGQNSATAADRVPSLPLENGILRPGSPGEGPSGSTSISMSIGSMGDDSGERSLNEPSIAVSVIPEKKGIFLKHSEYEIKAKSYGSVVRRRYKDFVVLYNYLLEKYPYRIIPSLPPKQLMLNSLLEERRRGLQTWLTIISMHPVLGSSPILTTFLGDKTTDHQYRMRVMYEKQIDEFARLREDVELPLPDDQENLAASRDRLRKVLQSLQRLRKIFDEQAFRAEQSARDMAEVDQILQGLEVRDVFGDQTFDDVSQSAQAVARHSERYSQLQRNAVNERIYVLMEVLSAHNELCERVEKGILADYQKALSRTINLGKMKMKTVIRGSTPENVSSLAQRESAQSGEADVLSRKCAFALQCVRSETALTERYLQSLPSILLSYANEESQYHSKMSKIWHQLVASESSKLC
ncbi:sorting nexin-8-like isoform X2 [Uranotaenia lowii]|uniref:sorting nexin-8-like isoform X2 n=1 Tax=Uranotaenia lowii TaxID=190385 RepID=UPI00247A5B32|nr:sorting nexin-8-like isoform X2 [Uranotaenia lowii]